MTNIIGKPTARKAKPVMMTFYDSLKDYPYRSTFYVRDETPESDCLALITATCALSLCVLGKYTIGYRQYWIPGYEEHFVSFKNIVMGTEKWAIKYRPETHYRVRSHTIPGKNSKLSLGARPNSPNKMSPNPDPEHPLWVTFMEVFRRICVSEEGDTIPDRVELGLAVLNWPQKDQEDDSTVSRQTF